MGPRAVKTRQRGSWPEIDGRKGLLKDCTFARVVVVQRPTRLDGECRDYASKTGPQMEHSVMIENISAITQATHNMSRAVRFYRMLGFEMVHGGDDAAFTSFRAGTRRGH